MGSAADAVVASTRRRYPKLDIPVHSRWRHFEAGGVDRKAELDRLLQPMKPAPRAHSMIDLAVVSVLLDAGAGPEWKYVEPATGKTFTRSEGLGVASFHAFTAGLFSSDKDRPLQADAKGLRGLVTDHLAAAFQVTETNPLVGIRERAVLLRRLGERLIPAQRLKAQRQAFLIVGRQDAIIETHWRHCAHDKGRDENNRARHHPLFPAARHHGTRSFCIAAEVFGGRGLDEVERSG